MLYLQRRSEGIELGNESIGSAPGPGILGSPFPTLGDDGSCTLVKMPLDHAFPAVRRPCQHVQHGDLQRVHLDVQIVLDAILVARIGLPVSRFVKVRKIHQTS